jgi:sensor histidine kinase YesM
MNRQSLYWFSQTCGWFFYTLLIGFYTQIILGFKITPESAFSLFLIFVLGIFFSHLYRLLILKLKLKDLKPLQLTPILLLLCLVFASVFAITQAFVEYIVFNVSFLMDYLMSATMLTNIVSINFVFIVWSLIYFLIHYIKNYRLSEIENLRWQASVVEIELNKLKSQLNPHFIFNSMNSIRALVDEDPSKSKEAITQLSNILRNTLLMGKKRLIPFSEEMLLVKDYLNLETTRFEERLTTKYDIDATALDYEIPPMLLQTIVENGIKHGISKLPEGGEISINAKVTDDKMQIEVINCGQLSSQKSETGFGIINTKQRLHLIFGDKASLLLTNYDSKKVLTKIILPKL